MPDRESNSPLDLLPLAAGERGYPVVQADFNPHRSRAGRRLELFRFSAFHEIDHKPQNRRCQEIFLKSSLKRKIALRREPEGYEGCDRRRSTEEMDLG